MTYKNTSQEHCATGKKNQSHAINKTVILWFLSNWIGDRTTNCQPFLIQRHEIFILGVARTRLQKLEA